MKKVFLVIVVLLFSAPAFAEATFDQIQSLIKAHEYNAAIQGLNLIIQNHPRSSKAFYAMAQAQAGVGNQAKAKEALDMAKGLDPSLKFASSSNVENLSEAIQPQTKKIEAIESHWLRNCLILFLLAGGVCFFLFRRKKEQKTKLEPQMGNPYCAPTPENSYSAQAQAKEAYAYHNNVQHPYRSYVAPQPSAPTHTTVVNNNGGSGNLVTGIVLGEMMAGSHHQHVVVEKEYIREESPIRDEPNRSSTWDDKPNQSSSWDSGSSSSSSWDSNSGSPSSWDSDSSSSSWD